ncbi:MAG: amidase family protein [Desulfobacterales bacterium]|nr:amidase family protein [Desulfobacterales bacterium]
MATAEASSNLARYDGVKYGYRTPKPERPDRHVHAARAREGFGAEVKRRIMHRHLLRSVGRLLRRLLRARRSQVRTLIRRGLHAGLRGLRRRSPDPDLADRRPSGSARRSDDPLQMYLADVFTISANLAGVPGMQRQLRLHGRRPADRPADPREAIRRGARFCERRMPTSRRRRGGRGDRSL